MIKVKICGITNKEDALAAVDAGAVALGFIFYKKSPRYALPSKVRSIIRKLPPFITPVGVFVNDKEKEVKAIADFCALKTLQLHGNEGVGLCHRLTKNYTVIKAFRVGKDFDVQHVLKYKVQGYLFDTFQKEHFGGTGETFDWKTLKEIRKQVKPILLSGGLTSQNVLSAIKVVRPYAVDVSSGVESSPGQKDEKSIKKFLREVAAYG